MSDCAIDKSAWPLGRWTSEPDFGEFVAHGFPCTIRRHEHAGHLCGYVGVPSRHALYGLSYEAVPWQQVECHGGLTFARIGDDTHRSRAFWWFGFDCAHLGDLSPGYLGLLGRGPDEDEVYRDWVYVRAEVTTLARQLARLRLRWFGRIILAFYELRSWASRIHMRWRRVVATRRNATGGDA